MPDILASSTAVDLSRLPAPTVIEQLSFDMIFADLLDLIRQPQLLPAFDATVASDPAVKILEVFAYREMLLRQQFNDRALQLMVAYATGANLDNLAALVGVGRLVLHPGEPSQDVAPTFESDDALRQRIVLAAESFSVAGPELAYVFHAKSADGDVLDASAISPAPGEVLVSVLSRAGDGTAPADTLAAVEAIVNDRAIRPLGDLVTVASAEILQFTIDATLHTFSGPDLNVVLAAAEARLLAYLDESRRLGRDITTSGLIAALMVAGVQRVILAEPSADVICGPTQAAHCTEISVGHGGYAE
ncbi:baseplate assembly protein [Sphingomonas sp.]|uniref:baseplate assembly protein n=1 Tax=Sphingomonas sp. TaxID=28214 RepID=UPI002ED93F08